MKLLLHACCADCTLRFLASNEEKGNLDVYYYNPNIHPRSEYQSRLKAIQQICEKEKVKLIIADWSPKEYFGAIKSKDKEVRCAGCWTLRLEKTAAFAAENGYTHFASTLITSEYQDKDRIQNIAKLMAAKYNVELMTLEHVCSKLETSGFYKQFFCGCAYSLTERFEEKYRTGT